MLKEELRNKMELRQAILENEPEARMKREQLKELKHLITDLESKVYCLNCFPEDEISS